MKYTVLTTLAIIFALIASALFTSALQQQQHPLKKILSNNKKQSTMKMSQAWKYSTGTNSPIYSTPVITPHTLFLGAGDKLVALNRDNGNFNWTYQAKARIFATPTVYAPFSALIFGDAAGYLHSVSLDKGEMKFSVNISTEPLVGEVAIAGTTAVVGSFDSSIYGVDLTTGKLAWNVSTSNFVSASPVVTKGHNGNAAVVVGSQDGVVYCIDTTTGLVNWKYEIRAPIRDRCAVSSDNSVAYCAAKNGKLYAINITTGAKINEFNLNGGSAMAAPVLSGSTLYVPSGFDKMFALNAETGAQQWKFAFSSAYIQNRAAVSPDGSTVYFGADDSSSTLISVDASSGSQKSTFTGNAGGITTQATISPENNMVYFGTSKGEVFGVSI